MLGRLAIFALLPAVAAAQGTVEGTVTNSVTRAGAAGVTVTITSGDGYKAPLLTYTATTGAAGTFIVRNVREGTFRMKLESREYMAPRDGDSSTRPFHVADGGDPVHIDVAVVPWGKVRGRVLDEAGNPVARVQVEMIRYRGGGGSISSTDATGHFDVGGIGPGAYVLVARPVLDPGEGARRSALSEHPQDGERTTWAPTYYPHGANRSQAQVLVIHDGADIPNLDVRLTVVPVFRVRGTVVDDSGHPAAGVTVKLIEDLWGGVEAKAVTKEDGAFEFPSVRPCDCRLEASVRRGEVTILGVTRALVSKHDVEDVRLRMDPPFLVTGFVDREEPRDKKGERKVTMVLLDGGDDILRASAFHAQDGTLAIPNVRPGRYRIKPFGFVPGYYVDAVRLGEMDVMGKEVDLQPGSPPIRIVYKPNAGRVRGTVEECGKGWVYLVPQDETFLSDQYIRSAACRADGSFEVESLRPGDYYAFAFDRVDGPALGDATFVRGIAGSAEKVSVRQGEAAVVKLKITPWPE